MQRYVMLVGDATGLHLTSDERGKLGQETRCDDRGIWAWESTNTLRNASTGNLITVESDAGPSVEERAAFDASFGPGANELISPRYRLGAEEGPLPLLAGDRVFTVREAPARLPSAYLADLENQGWTVVENVMSPAMVQNLIANVNAVRARAVEKEARVKAAQDKRPYLSNDNVIRPRALMGKDESFLSMTPAMAQALMHPVSLWLIESYFGVEDIHYCQCPGISILRPAEKAGDLARVSPGGWHADYPYPLTSETEAHTFMLGPEEFEKLDASIAPRFPDWKRRQNRLGMQFNIALTDFTPETGATQFLLGSHEYDIAPPAELNAVPTRAGEGVHREVVQISYPAGSGILYDSRTYHRAPPELNVSGAERWAMLTCITPSFVRDLRARDDKVESADTFARASRLHQALTPRELKDVLAMLCDDEAGVPRRDIERLLFEGLRPSRSPPDRR